VRPADSCFARRVRSLAAAAAVAGKLPSLTQPLSSSSLSLAAAAAAASARWCAGVVMTAAVVASASRALRLASAACCIDMSSLICRISAVSCSFARSIAPSQTCMATEWAAAGQ
jgi:hypothetical protein